MIVASSYSIQAHKIKTANYEQLMPGEHHGRLRVAYFEFTVEELGFVGPTALTRLPANARLLEIDITHTDVPATTTITLGLVADDESGVLGTYYYPGYGYYEEYDSFGFLGNHMTFGSSNPYSWFKANKYGFILMKQTWLTMMLLETQVPAGAVIKGAVTYVVD